MGDKIEVCCSMIVVGVFCIFGIEGNVVDFVEVLCEVEWIGYLVMFKVIFGGGGCGICCCNSCEELEQVFLWVIFEVIKVFGSVEVFFEKCIVNFKYIEVQIFVDFFGNIVYLFECDCLIQCCNQKFIEIVLSLQFIFEQCVYIGDLVVCVVKVVGYENVGIVEFLFVDGEVYFMEMNIWVQVEYIIIEEIIGIDVVCEQICIVFGLELLVKQDDIVYCGYVLQFCINVEDLKNNFLFLFGKIICYYVFGGFGVCIDMVIYIGYIILLYYDLMCLKLIVWVLIWEEVFDCGLCVFDDMCVQGVKIIVLYYQEIFCNLEFCSGQFNISFVESYLELIQYLIKCNLLYLVIVIVIVIVVYVGL